MIDQTVNNAQASVAEANHDAINAILDAAETALLSAAVRHQLRGITIERWRWDQPEIVMSWVPIGGTPELGKNIRVYVQVGAPAPFTCSVASNAWLDEPLSHDTIRRHWESFADHTLDINDPDQLSDLESHWLMERIERAYDRIAESSEFVLTQAVLILPDGRSQSIDAPVHGVNGSVENEVRKAGE